MTAETVSERVQWLQDRRGAWVPQMSWGSSADRPGRARGRSGSTRSGWPRSTTSRRPRWSSGRGPPSRSSARLHRRTGLHVHGEQTVVRHSSGPWFATVDGFVCDGEVVESSIDDALGVFEAKYSADTPWSEVPEHYMLQAQWAMYCSGLDQVWLAALHMPFWPASVRGLRDRPQ